MTVYPRLLCGAVLLAAICPSPASADVTPACNTAGYSSTGLECGVNAVAGGIGGTAVGNDSHAYSLAVAVGRTAIASGSHSVAVGQLSSATGMSSVVVGNMAAATAESSVAIGAYSEANEANTVSFGSTDQQRRLVNIAAGSADTDAVNVAQLKQTNDQVAENSSAISDVEAVNTVQGTQIAALQAAIADFGGGYAGLASDVESLFDLRKSDRRDMKAGVAAAMAMAPAPIPSAPGKVAYSVNAASFRGQQAMAGSLSYRLNSRAPMAIGLGFSYGGRQNNGVRLGLAGEF